jgi:hypothetical protein
MITKQSITKNGYALITVGGKRKYEHRHVIEQQLGRELKRGEHVHHINGGG